jgi:hypothetical protein
VNTAAINMGVQVPLELPELHSFGYIPRSAIAGSYGRSMFSFLKKPPYCFPKSLYYLTFPPAVYEDSFFPTSLTTFFVGGVFDDSSSNRSEVQS